MRYLVDSQRMRKYDRNTSEYYGISTEVLMERASLSVADVICSYLQEKGVKRRYRVLVIAGVGNNGGDGICIARLLMQRGFIVSMTVVGDYTKSSDLLLKQLSICEKYGLTTDTFSNVRDNKNPSQWDIIVDAMFGIGLSRTVSGSYAEAVEYIAACKEERQDDLLVVSVDMPSGINADTGAVCGCAVKADITVTFNQYKLGHVLYPGCEYTGKLMVKDAGITDESFLSDFPRAFCYDENPKELLPVRDPDSNKGSNGKVLIIAGSKRISGACILAATACLKSGAGMVRIFTACENAEAVKALLPEALLDVYEDFEPCADKLKEALKWSTQAVIGPGIGTEGKGIELVDTVLSCYDKDLVMDADALNIIAADEILKAKASEYTRGNKKLIITPHLAEFARLFGRDVKDCKDHILEYPSELASKMHCTVVCKDARTVVADSNEKKIYINVSGNDGMATAGSGDVLAGILGALTNSFKSGFESACVGTYIHGIAGDRAAAKIGKYSMVASDITGELAEILR
ncbi:MAG: NAD(P)H-hydrate dehydratase [Butyrivibrio sp.]|nr:NAD(P)H-hydrate dehydratase [Butyrivibrio sp.]